MNDIHKNIKLSTKTLFTANKCLNPILRKRSRNKLLPYSFSK